MDVEKTALIHRTVLRNLNFSVRAKDISHMAGEANVVIYKLQRHESDAFHFKATYQDSEDAAWGQAPSLKGLVRPLIRAMTTFNRATKESRDVLICIAGDGKTWIAQLHQLNDALTLELDHIPNVFVFDDLSDVVEGPTMEEAVANLYLCLLNKGYSFEVDLSDALHTS